MYNQEFWDRVNVQQICEFFKYGSESANIDSGSYPERHRQYTKALMNGIHNYRKQVLLTDWDSMHDENARIIKGETLADDILDNMGNLSDLAFEVGFMTGLKIGCQFKDSSSAEGFL